MPERFRVVCTMQGAIQVLWFTFYLYFLMSHFDAWWQEWRWSGPTTVSYWPSLGTCVYRTRSVTTNYGSTDARLNSSWLLFCLLRSHTPLVGGVDLSCQRHLTRCWYYKVKFSHTCYRALGPELFWCTGSQPTGEHVFSGGSLPLRSTTNFCNFYAQLY